MKRTRATARRTRGAWLAAMPIAAILLAAPALAQERSELRDAEEPVMRQLEAFRRDDYDTAYGFASASIRELFDRQAFERMVRRGYPAIARSAFAVITERTLASDGHAYLRLKIAGADGSSIDAVYEMVYEDGRWRINGVVAGPAPGLI